MSVNTSFMQILQNSLMNDKPQYKEIVSEEQLNQLKKYNFVKSECEYECCPISMKMFKEGEEITKLECGHIFDSESIKQWVTTEKASCPICRFKLKSKQIRISQSNQENLNLDSSNNDTSESQSLPVSDNPSTNIMDSSYNITYNSFINQLRNVFHQEQLALNLLTEYISQNSDENAENETTGEDDLDETTGEDDLDETANMNVDISANRQYNSDLRNLFNSIINAPINNQLLNNQLNSSYRNTMNYRRMYRMNSYISDSDIALQQAIMESMGETNEIVDTSGNE